MISRILHRYNVLYVALCFVLVLQAQLVYVLYQAKGCNNPEALVSFLDVGQGDSVYIQDTDGKSILIDTGPKDQSLIDKIEQVTNCSDVYIDTLLLTHPDADHIGEAKRLIDKGLVGEVVHNGFMDIDQPDETFMENELEETYIPKRKVSAGDSIDLRDIYIEVLFPIEPPYLKEMSTSTKVKKKTKVPVDDNIYSLVTRVTYTNKKETVFMLTGDASIVNEEVLISKYGNKLQSDVLKLGHHGSKSSTGQKFLSYVKPEEVVISAGKNNRYNHPNEDTMERVYEQRRKKPLKIRETFVEGNILYKLEL